MGYLIGLIAAFGLATLVLLILVAPYYISRLYGENNHDQ